MSSGQVATGHATPLYQVSIKDLQLYKVVVPTATPLYTVQTRDKPL